MQKDKSGPGPGMKKYGILFTTKYSKHPAHEHAIFDSHCNVTRSAQERQHHSCRLKSSPWVPMGLDFSKSVN